MILSSRIELVAGRRWHAGTIAARLRAADRLECAAMGYSPRAALRHAIAGSSICLTALVDGRPEAMMGLEVRSAIEGRGVPWMLATDVAYRHGRELVEWGPVVIQAFADSTPSLSNLVSAGNTRAIRVLRRWGFTVEAEERTVGGVPFLTFERIS